MSELKVGDIIRDNDPRTTNRKLEVVEIGDGRVSARLTGATYGRVKQVSILRNRIHADDKPRRSGFSVVRP